MDSKLACNPDTTCVLTTPERVDIFRAAVGSKADFRLNPMQTSSLADYLYNFQTGGGRIAILDEDHFVTTDLLCDGLQRFLDSGDFNDEKLRLIVVCSRRKCDAAILSFLVAYCAIYDVIYDMDGACLSAELTRLLRRRNARADVLDIVNAAWKERFSQKSAQEMEIPLQFEMMPSQSFAIKVSIKPCFP